MRRLRTHRTCKSSEYPPVHLVDSNAAQSDAFVVTVFPLFADSSLAPVDAFDPVITPDFDETNDPQNDSFSTGNTFGIGDANLRPNDALSVTLSVPISDSSAAQDDVLAAYPVATLADSNAAQGDTLVASLSASMADSNATPVDAFVARVKALLADSNSTQADAASARVQAFLADSNATPTDVLTARIRAVLADTGATPSDVLAAHVIASLAESNAAQTDAIVASVVSPAAQNLSGWWRGYAGALPFAGTPSAGISGNAGQRLVSAASDPAVGALNGFGTMSFNGTTNLLKTFSAPGTFFGVGGTMTITALAWITNCGAYGFTSGVSDANFFICDSAPSIVGTSFAKYTGVPQWAPMVQDGGGTYIKPAPMNLSLGAWAMYSMRCDGTRVRSRINGGAENVSALSLASAPVYTATDMILGSAYNGSSAFFNGFLAELMVSPVDLGTAGQDVQRNYFNSRYGLAL
jgi:hypothetical protein